MPNDPTRRVIILGSTGSIGTQTIEVIEYLNGLHERGRCPVRFDVVGLCAHRNVQGVLDQARRHRVANVAITRAPPTISEGGVEIIRGIDAPEQLVQSVDCDLVIGAMVGIAGLRPIASAIDLGRDVALANKETLVSAGEIIMDLARARGCRVLPLDSEHAGAWLCLRALSPAYCPPDRAPAGIARMTITASGGPFRDHSPESLRDVGPADALRHPTWTMGPKNTIDSATMMNKALELIEARWLFDLGSDRLDAVIQPTSIAHALIQTVDGSTIAQLSSPDMRLPIQQALTYPHRSASLLPPIDPCALGELRFGAIDPARFEAIELARRAMDAGGSAGAVLSAANEVAVEAFLDERLRFDQITPLVRGAMDAIEPTPITSLDDVSQADASARAWAIPRIEQIRI